MKKKLVYKATINVVYEKYVDESILKRVGNEKIKENTDNSLISSIKGNTYDSTDTKISINSDIKEVKQNEV